MREESLKTQSSALNPGHDLIGALPLPVIDMLVRDSEIIRSHSMFESKYPIFGDLSRAWDIISTSGTSVSRGGGGMRAECSATLSDSTRLRVHPGSLDLSSPPARLCTQCSRCSGLDFQVLALFGQIYYLG